jgi:hypothetical protein
MDFLSLVWAGGEDAADPRGYHGFDHPVEVLQ